MSSALFLKSTPVVNADSAILKVPTQLHEAEKHFSGRAKEDALLPYQIVCKKNRRSREENKIPLTYIGMIAQAISSSPEKKLVLADIYRYMQRNFSRYLRTKARWKNTVRHNLSYHKCFVKCESSKGTKRSHYWIIHQDFVEQFNRENYNKELDDVPAINETNPKPSPSGQQLNFPNHHGHLQPQVLIATSGFDPRELTFAHEYKRMIPALVPNPNAGDDSIPFMLPQRHTESYIQQFAMAYSHQGPLKFQPRLHQQDPAYRYPVYHQFLPVHGEFNSFKTPTTSTSHTQEFSEDYTR